MTLPLISILIPVFNNEERIERAVRTAFEQDYFKHTFEVIVLDDGSDDQTFEILQELQDEFLDLRIIRSEEHLGNLKARWRLFNESTGEYIFYLCGDCSMTRKALWKSYDAIAKYEADMLLTAYIPSIVGMRQPRIGVADSPEWYGTTTGFSFISKAAASSRGCFHGHGKLIKREAIQNTFDKYLEAFETEAPINTRDGEIFVSLIAKSNPRMKIAAQDIETTIVVLPRRDDDMKPAAKNRMYAAKFQEEMKGRTILKEILTGSEYSIFDKNAEFDVRPAGDIKCSTFVENLNDMKQLLTPAGFANIADNWLGWSVDGIVKRCSNDIWEFLNVTSDEPNRAGYMLIFDEGRIAYNPRWAMERLGTKNLWLKMKENNQYDEFSNVRTLSEHDMLSDCFEYPGPFLLIGSENIEGLRASIFFWIAEKEYYWYV